MRAISLWQPWATLCVIGAKRIETRHWSTPYRGLLAIHAAKRWTAEEKAFAASPVFADALNGRGFNPASLPLGAVVGTVNLVDVVRTEKVRDSISAEERAFGNFSDGRYAWLLETPALFDVPFPMKGAQGFFEWEPPESRAPEPPAQAADGERVAQMLTRWAERITVMKVARVEEMRWCVAVAHGGHQLETMMTLGGEQPYPRRVVSALWAMTAVARNYRPLDRFIRFMRSGDEKRLPITDEDREEWSDKYDEWTRVARWCTEVFGEEFGVWK